MYSVFKLSTNTYLSKYRRKRILSFLPILKHITSRRKMEDLVSDSKDDSVFDRDSYVWVYF